MQELKFNDNVRHDLIRYAFENMELHYDFKKYKNKKLDYILCDLILVNMFYCITNQINKYSTLYNNNLNKLLYYTLQQMITCDSVHEAKKEKLILRFKAFGVSAEYNYNNTLILSRSKDRSLVNYCKLYLEKVHTYKNSNSPNINNEIADDKFLFEKVIKKAAIELYNEDKVTQRIKKQEDIGGALWADTVIKVNECSYLIMDAKFYGSNLINNYNNEDSIVYAKYHNKFQMNAYVDELKSKTGLVDDQVTGILVHAVDKERYNEFKRLTNDNIKIRDNTIHIELILIDVSAEEIIAQIKDMILTYSK